MVKGELIVIHYHEIALKGKNRDFFEHILVENIKKSLGGSLFKTVERRRGRVIVFLKEGVSVDEVRKRIKAVFGVANFSFAKNTELDLEALKRNLWEEIKDEKPKSFRVTVKRSNKRFPGTSQELAKDIGSFLFESFGGKVPVDLEEPDLHCFVEIGNLNIFYYFKKEKGYAGLPVGTAGKVMSLVSSGFDSPVASWKMMRRGARVFYVHFFSYPYTTKDSYENVKGLIGVLDKYQFGSKIFFIPFADAQKEISLKCEASYRVVLYRRLMLRIAERLAKREGIKALITGDSLAQVASQTLDNMSVISESVRMPILRPLVGENKNDIIDLAKEIGTHDLSSQPYEDCCSLFMPKSPETHAKLEKVLEEEAKIDIEKMMEDAILKVEVLKV